MALFLRIVFGLIGFGLYTLVTIALIEWAGGACIFWPWVDKTEISCIKTNSSIAGAGNSASQQEIELLKCANQLMECKINAVLKQCGGEIGPASARKRQLARDW